MYIPRRDWTGRGAEAGHGIRLRPAWLVPFLLLVALGTGCEPYGENQALEYAPSSDEPVVTVASTTQMEVLNSTLPTHLAITRAYAVRAENETFGHYVAAKLRRPSDSLWDGQTLALWYMPDGMDVPGRPFAVDSTARAFGSTAVYDPVSSSAIRNHAEIVALLDLTLSRP